MSQYTDGVLTSKASATFSKFARVVLDSSAEVAAGGATAHWIGVALAPALAVGDIVAIMPRNKAGTISMLASGTIAAAGRVELAADGKVQAIASKAAMGIAMLAASDGNQVEVLLMGGTDVA